MKKFVSILLLLVMLLSLTACHGSRDERTFAIPEEFDTTKNYEISFWAKNDTNMTQVEIYKSAIAAFEERYPNIKEFEKIARKYGVDYAEKRIAVVPRPSI